MKKGSLEASYYTGATRHPASSKMPITLLDDSGRNWFSFIGGVGCTTSSNIEQGRYLLVSLSEESRGRYLLKKKFPAARIKE
jgi:hypothetical protein